MGAPLEIAGAHKRTEEGNVSDYYGGGGVAYATTALACAYVPLAVRRGQTVGVWENGKIAEYIWHTDTSNTGLVRKTVDVDLEPVYNRIGEVEENAAFTGINPGEINDLDQVGINKAGGIYRLDFGAGVPVVNAPLVTDSLQVVQAGNDGRGMRLVASYSVDRYFLQRALTEGGGWQSFVEIWHTANFDPTTIPRFAGKFLSIEDLKAAYPAIAEGSTATIEHDDVKQMALFRESEWIVFAGGTAPESNTVFPYSFPQSF